MYVRIVVPLDGSLVAEEALPHAEELARALGVPIVLLRVIDNTPVGLCDNYGVAVSYVPGTELADREEASAREYLTARQEQIVARGVETTTTLRRGPVVRELLGAARNGDLYVMASHGRTGMPRWFLGSVAEEMTRVSSVPVMLVRSRQEPAGSDREGAL
ncbi:MAG TPA: universal stress protein [Thermomicrobiales bacterium]|nr:universal stress protein [Thermomicrobiales bacterium]